MAQVVHQVNLLGKSFGITFSDDLIGVCNNGYGRIKYMPVAWDHKVHGCIPVMLKTKLKSTRSAEELIEDILLAVKLQGCYRIEYYQLCQHILAHGHTPR